jgi:hypothetical protein
MRLRNSTGEDFFQSFELQNGPVRGTEEVHHILTAESVLSRMPTSLSTRSHLSLPHSSVRSLRMKIPGRPWRSDLRFLVQQKIVAA